MLRPYPSDKTFLTFEKSALTPTRGLSPLGCRRLCDKTRIQPWVAFWRAAIKKTKGVALDEATPSFYRINGLYFVGPVFF